MGEEKHQRYILVTFLLLVAGAGSVMSDELLRVSMNG